MFLIPLIPLFRWPASLHRWCEDQQSSLLVQDGGVKASWALHSCHLTVWEEQHHPLHTESLCHLWLLPHTLHRSLQESVWEKSKCVLCGCVCVCVSVCVFVFIIYVWRITWLLLHSSITHNFYISRYKKKRKKVSMYSPHWKKGGKKRNLGMTKFQILHLTCFARLLVSGKEQALEGVPTTVTPTTRTPCTRSDWTTTPLTTTSWLSCVDPSKSHDPKAQRARVNCSEILWRLMPSRWTSAQDIVIELSLLHFLLVINFVILRQMFVGRGSF